MKANLHLIFLMYPGRLLYRLRMWYWTNLAHLVTAFWKKVARHAGHHWEELVNDYANGAYFEMYQWGPFEVVIDGDQRRYTVALYWGTKKHQMVRCLHRYSSHWWHVKVVGGA
jgi:hypothetical protein